MKLGTMWNRIAATAGAACFLLAPEASSDDNDSAEQSTSDYPTVVFESPYKLGNRYALQSEVDAKRESDAILRWNTGGRAGTWHPEPRVIVNVVRVQGPIASAAVLKNARARGYWPIRNCYDPVLPESPTLDGTVTVRVTVDTKGKATKSIVLGQPTLPNEQVVNCIKNILRSFPHPPSLRATADVTINVTVSPGDAPTKRVEDPPASPGTGTISFPVVQATIARHAGPTIQNCYADAKQRVPGLWGRLVLRLDVGRNGAIREIIETESTFPDQSTIRCAIEAISVVGLPPPTNGDLRIVLPIRFGTGTTPTK